MEKAQKKMAKKENDLKKAKYRKKLEKMSRRRTTLTEALHARAYELDLERSDSSGSGSSSSSSGSDDDRRPRPAVNRGHSAARRRDAGRAQGPWRSRSAHQDVRAQAHDRRPRSMSVDRATMPTRRGDKRTKAKTKTTKGKGKRHSEGTWNWAEMMRNGLRSLHSRNDSVRMKDSELIKMAKRSATAYFNIESSSTSSASGLLVRSPVSAPCPSTTATRLTHYTTRTRTRTTAHAHAHDNSHQGRGSVCGVVSFFSRRAWTCG
jgi:hypothetical protein